MKDMNIADRLVGPTHPPFIVAEMSGNHQQSLEKAMAIVDAVAETGAHALKLQTYTADTMTLDVAGREFSIEDPKSLWYGRTLHQLYEEAHTPWEWQKAIFERCHQKGLIAFSTPFDISAVDFLEELNVPAYKIATYENSDLPLIRKVAATGKPLIISAGIANLSQLDETVRTARKAGGNDIILLKCTNRPPATPEGANLRTIGHMMELFDVQVGLSDHTLGVGVAVAAVAQGATMVEKHFTLNRTDGGVDAAFSLEPEEMRTLVVETERAWQALGEVTYSVTSGEKRSLQFRRSLYVTADIKAGEKLTAENLRSIRPGSGLPPKYYERLLGKRVNRDIKRGTAMDWEMIG